MAVVHSSVIRAGPIHFACLSAGRGLREDGYRCQASSQDQASYSHIDLISVNRQGVKQRIRKNVRLPTGIHCKLRSGKAIPAKRKTHPKVRIGVVVRPIAGETTAIRVRGSHPQLPQITRLASLLSLLLLHPADAQGPSTCPYGQVWYRLLGRPTVLLCEMQGIALRYS